MATLRGLRRVREARGLSQADLAARSGVSRWTISHLERGRGEPHPQTTERLAEALGVEPAELARDA
jgi:transcriptional regulator with XRE-family HTH domain